MRKTIVLAGLLAAVAAVPALAQDWRNGRGERPAQSVRAERPQRNFEARAQMQAQAPAQVQAQAPRAEWQGRRGDGGQQWQGRRNFNGQADANAAVQAQARAQAQTRFRDRDGDGIRNRRDFDANGNGRVDRRYDWNRDGRADPRFDRNRDGRVDPRYGYNNGYGRPGFGGNWNRDWRNDRRYDWNSYRNYNRRLFSQSRYYAPYGWNYGYRRFSIGIYLDSLLFSRNYWIDDPYQYRLPPAYPPYRWIRYYNDALLIDERSGYVVDTIYDFFY